MDCGTKVLNLVLTANPIGLIVAAIGALVGALVMAYKNCEGFRNIVDKVLGVITKLAIAIKDSLVKAFKWLIDKAKSAYEWLIKILGLGGKKAKVDVEVQTTNTTTSVNLDETKRSTRTTSRQTVRLPKPLRRRLPPRYMTTGPPP